MMRPPAFDELERLAIWLAAEGRASQARAAGLREMPNAAPDALLVQARNYKRAAEIMDWLKGRANRLHLLADAARERSR